MLANFREKDKAARYGKEKSHVGYADVGLPLIDSPKSNSNPIYLALISIGRSCSAELSAMAAQLDPAAEIQESRL